MSVGKLLLFCFQKQLLTLRERLLLLTEEKPAPSGNSCTMHSHTVIPQRITRKEEVASGVFLLGFKRNFDFNAGQVIGIALEKEGPRRLYSICSGEHEEEILILFNVVVI